MGKFFPLLGQFLDVSLKKNCYPTIFMIFSSSFFLQKRFKGDLKVLHNVIWTSTPSAFLTISHYSALVHNNIISSRNDKTANIEYL